MGSPILLCIDDGREQLDLRKAALESNGFCVETATNGYAAIKMLEETSVVAVLLEYKQQGIDAEAIAYQIRRRFPKVPIILLSAYFEMPERILWLVDAYVMTSELPDGLVHVIERVTCPTNTDAARSNRLIQAIEELIRAHTEGAMDDIDKALRRAGRVLKQAKLSGKQRPRITRKISTIAAPPLYQ